MIHSGFLAARAMDACVCMARQYADMLRVNGVHNVVHIPMGFDAERFRPSLVLGVVGWLEHPRKGRELVERIRRLPFVELLTTEGRVAEADLREFYQRLDYVLIPATVEGGPMSLLEGLSMGKPVIVPRGVGIEPELPESSFVLRYRVGDERDLVKLVTWCWEKKTRTVVSCAGAKLGDLGSSAPYILSSNAYSHRTKQLEQ